MQITHVIRDAEWLPSTSCHLQVYQALGWQAPQFVHLPPIVQGGALLNDTGPGAVLDGYKDKGYLAPAIANHLARLGWSPRGKRRLRSLEELADAFDLRRVSRSPAPFDVARLDWFNRRAISALGATELAQLLVPRWQAAYGVAHRAEGTALSPGEWQHKLALAIRSELYVLAQAPEKARFAFVDRVQQQPDGAETLAQAYAPDILRAFIDGIAGLAAFTFECIDAFVTALRYRFKASHHIRSRDVMFVIRAALTGELGGPCLVEACELLGRRRCVERAKAALSGHGA
jgi:nondiscriminating glutamyl-tRNA synthetase